MLCSKSLKKKLMMLMLRLVTVGVCLIGTRNDAFVIITGVEFCVASYLNSLFLLKHKLHNSRPYAVHV